MSSRSFILSLVLFIVLVSGGLALLYWQNQEPATVQAPRPPASVISATGVRAEMWKPSLQSIGTLLAVNGIDISTEVNGIISDIAFRSGQEVEKGDVLIRLDDAIDKAALEALQADQLLAEVQYKRILGLMKKSVTSKSEFDEAEARFDGARARVREQQEIIKRKAIRAPFSGVTGIRKVDIGQFIETGDAIVSLQQLDPIYVDYTIPERFLTQVKTGQEIHATFDALPGQRFSGTISAIDSGIDTGTHTLKIRGTLRNPDGLLRPGMFSQVETITGGEQTVLTIPRTAISFNTYGNYAFVINKGENDSLSVKRTLVKTGDIREGRIVVENLDEGVEVVRTGLVKLRDGMNVTIDNSISLDDAEIGHE